MDKRSFKTAKHRKKISEGLKRHHAKKGRKSGSGKWLDKAIKHPGALRKQLGTPTGQKIPMRKLRKASKSSNPTLAKRANLAITLRGLKRPTKKPTKVS